VKLTDPLVGRYRFRTGDYRVVFDIVEETLQILAVGHRKDIYR
jgi:mRNA-degrading endonuclease RelE of RelBE toxin-antitoxin system